MEIYLRWRTNMEINCDDPYILVVQRGIIT